MQLLVGAVQVFLHLLQRLHMAGAGNVGAFGSRLPASHGQQLLAQCIQPVAGLGRKNQRLIARRICRRMNCYDL